jgi:uncharacterized protein involved in exopolysaccharide biosynthesis
MLETSESGIAGIRHSMRSTTSRDFIAIIFRHKCAIIFSFLIVFLGISLIAFLSPKEYETRFKILIKRERMDAPITSGSSSQTIVTQDITQEDLNTEVDLLKSRDLLEKVAVSCKLQELPPSFMEKLSSFLGGENAARNDMRVPRAVIKLEKKMEVEAVAKSKMIEVRYRARDPQLAAHVLATLSSLYLEKHLEVNRPPGVLDFFVQQTGQYLKGLSSAEEDLAKFARQEGVVSIDLEKDIALHKLSDFESLLREAQAQKAAMEERVKSLELQAARTPVRVTTQVRTADNPYLIQQMESTILSLELKKTELLSKYEPAHRSVQEVETQLAQARNAMAQAQKNPTKDESTDLDKTRSWLDEELARSRSELATMKARIAELSQSVADFKERARQIGQKEIAHQDLSRTAKTAEANYLLYLNKQEEARISDALDRKRIVNATIAEAATVPALPASPNLLLDIALGFVLAILFSLSLAFVMDYLDPTFRTPEEVENLLGIPVLASTPRS